MSVQATKAYDSHWLDDLISRLVREHHRFAQRVKEIGMSTATSESLHVLLGDYNDLRDDLVEHMLVEEHDFYPELIRRGKFDEFVSGIMQQHHEISAALGKMDLAIRVENRAEFRRSLDELNKVLGLHQPAEEEKVFPLVSSLE